jgi:hypothetical protein
MTTLTGLYKEIVDFVIHIQKVYNTESGSIKRGIVMSLIKERYDDNEQIVEMAEGVIDLVFHVARDKKIIKLLKKTSKCCLKK